jgi:hypothetical protein
MTYSQYRKVINYNTNEGTRFLEVERIGRRLDREHEDDIMLLTFRVVDDAVESGGWLRQSSKQANMNDHFICRGGQILSL